MSLRDDEKAAVLDLLAGNALFAATDRGTLEEMALLLKRGEYAAGDPVFLEEESSNHVYFIGSGTLEIVKYDPRTRQISRLKTLSPGEQFSEISAITRANHSTSCFALEPCVLYSLDYQLFMGFLHSRPEVAERIVRNLASLNRRLTSTDGYVGYCRESDFVYSPDMQQILPIEVIDSYEVLPIVLDSQGSLTLAMIDPYNVQFFSLFSRTRRTIRLKVTAIRRRDFDRVRKAVLASYKKNQTVSVPPATSVSAPVQPSEQTLRELLMGSTVFSKLPVRLIDQLVTLFMRTVYPAGSTVFEAGQASDTFFLIESGVIGLNRKFQEGVSVEIVSLGQNDSFGEISLLTESTYELQATATTDCTVYALPKAVITKLLKSPSFSIPLAKVLADRIQTLNRLARVRFYSVPLTVTQTMLSGLIPLQVMKEHQILPIELKENEIIVGMVNPDDANVFSALLNRYLNSYRVNIFAIRQADFERVLGNLTAKIQLLPAHLQPVEAEDEKHDQIGTIERLERILWKAVQKRSSDIHFEALEKEGAVRFRIDGELTESQSTIPKDEFFALTNRIKVTAKMDIGEKRLPQDGMFETVMNGMRVYGRVSCVPGVFGETTVIRLVIGQQSPRPLRMLAPDRRTISFLRNVVQFRQGVFLITGPTGSGKTSTLYSAIRELNSIGRKIITIEDPVEIIVPGATQISIQEKIGLGFDKVLRYVLRQDPDVILVGEIRDAVSAKFVFEAALTGHLVFSTLHSSNSIDAIPRLMELGVSQSLLASGLIGVMAQRLVPATCSQCKYARPIQPAEAEALKSVLKMRMVPRKLLQGRGCEFCANTGYVDRIPVFEFWKNRREIRDLLHRGMSLDSVSELIKQDGFSTLGEFGMTLALNGLTTVDQIRKNLFGFDLSVELETVKRDKAA